jgi:ATP-dependent Clp protease ATP-binding subunit ClpC
VFERFTQRARQSVVLAQEESRALRHSYLGTEHLLLGLLRMEEGLAAKVLASLDVTVEAVRDAVVRSIGEGSEPSAGEAPFTPKAKRTLELALREALSLGHNYIGTEHILLALARVEDGVAAQILAGLGADSAKVRAAVSAMMPEPLPPRRTGRRRRRGLTPPMVVQGPPPKQQTTLQTLLPVAFGWLLFGLAAGAGLLVGWLIWG